MELTNRVVGGVCKPEVQAGITMLLGDGEEVRVTERNALGFLQCTACPQVFAGNYADTFDVPWADPTNPYWDTHSCSATRHFVAIHTRLLDLPRDAAQRVMEDPPVDGADAFHHAADREVER